MLPKPIGPRAHGLIDYAFVAYQLFAPRLFGLRGKGRLLAYLFGASQGFINTFTDQPYGLLRIIPFKQHGQLELPFVPALLVLPWMTGALKHRGARRFFLPFFLIALANYALTDYRARERRVPRAWVPAEPREVVPV